MNRFEFIGRLAHEPEERHTQDGKTVMRFSFAVNRTRKVEGQLEADFFHVVMFGDTAERFSKLNVAKGTKLFLAGEISNDNYEKDGVKHYGYQFRAYSFEFCESKTAQKPVEASSVIKDTFVPDDAKIGDFVPLDSVSDEGMPWDIL